MVNKTCISMIGIYSTTENYWTETNHWYSNDL